MIKGSGGSKEWKNRVESLHWVSRRATRDVDEKESARAQGSCSRARTTPTLTSTSGSELVMLKVFLLLCGQDL